MKFEAHAPNIVGKTKFEKSEKPNKHQFKRNGQKREIERNKELCDGHIQEQD